MKVITTTFTVSVPDDAVAGYDTDPNSVSSPYYKTVMDLYDHICSWNGNEDGTVYITDQTITEE